MEAFGILKFWRNATAGNEVRNAAFGTDDDETDEDNSFFDLVFKSPACKVGNEDLKKECQFVESPKDVFLSKSDFSVLKPLSPAVTLLRSTPKFKVFMLGFRKSSRCDKSESNGELKMSPLNQSSKSSKIEQSNVKCRVEELPVASVFARDNSLRSRLQKENPDYETSEKSVSKYLKLIKPFYVKKSKSTDSVTPSSSPITAPVNSSPRKFSEGNRVGSFKIVARNLGKSRSASVSGAAVGAAPPSVRRRDDSLLEQHDGIQGAILHCKKSYNSSSKEFSQLFRFGSDPSSEESGPPDRNSCEEQKRCSI